MEQVLEVVGACLDPGFLQDVLSQEFFEDALLIIEQALEQGSLGL